MTDFTLGQLSHDEKKWEAFLILIKCVREFVQPNSAGDVEERTAWEKAVVDPPTMIFHKDHISNYNLRQALRFNGFSNSKGPNTLWHRERPRLSEGELDVIIKALEELHQATLRANSLFTLVTERTLGGQEIAQFHKAFEARNPVALKALYDAAAEARRPLTKEEMEKIMSEAVSEG